MNMMLEMPVEERVESLLVDLSEGGSFESGATEVRVSFAGETILEDAVSHFLAARANFQAPERPDGDRREVA